MNVTAEQTNAVNVFFKQLCQLTQRTRKPRVVCSTAATSFSFFMLIKLCQRWNVKLLKVNCIITHHPLSVGEPISVVPSCSFPSGAMFDEMRGSLVSFEWQQIQMELKLNKYSTTTTAAAAVVVVEKKQNTITAKWHIDFPWFTLNIVLVTTAWVCVAGIQPGGFFNTSLVVKEEISDPNLVLKLGLGTLNIQTDHYITELAFPERCGWQYTKTLA